MAKAFFKNDVPTSNNASTIFVIQLVSISAIVSNKCIFNWGILKFWYAYLFWDFGICGASKRTKMGDILLFISLAFSWDLAWMPG